MTMSNFAPNQQTALVDISLPDWQTLVAGLPTGMAVHTFTSLAQLAQWGVAHQGEYAAVHLLSHGTSGALKLGGNLLDTTRLNDALVQAQLQDLGKALTPDGDLLLYGCNVAQGQTGANFISKLAQLTHADVAASSNLTGDAALGGDWVLESTHSTVDAHPLALPHYAHLLVEPAVMLKDIYTGSNSSTPSNLTNVNGTLYFMANNGTNGYELWKTNGTAAGTVMVKDIYTGSTASSPTYLTNVNGTLYFRATDGTNGYELWKSDGTAAGTVLVKDIYTGSITSTPTYLTNVNGTLYFQANDGTNGYELWKSDAAGTVMVKDIRAGGDSYPNYLTNVNGTLYFTATNGTNGTELWKSDAAGTVMVKDIWAGGDSYPSSLTNVNGTLYFTADNGTNGYELWKSDAAGTVMVKDINTGGDSYTTSLTNVNGTLYFRASDGTNGIELWKSDGTDAGTVLVKDISAGSSDSNPDSLTNVNGTLYFTADNGTNGTELWKSDAAGTVMVKDIRAGGSSSPSSLTNVNGTLYFTATDGTNGTELWKTDGTDAGTVLVKDIRAGGSSSPSSLTNVNGTLYFTASDGTNGMELWKVDPATPPTATITAATLSADTGSNITDWITNTAAQTISGTLSTALVVDESVQVSYNNGTTWSAATSTVGSTSWSATATLAGSGTFQARVINAGANGTAYSQAYTLDTTIATPTLALAVDTGSSNSDGKTSNGQVNVSGLESGGTWQYSTDAGANWNTGTGSSFTLTGDGAKSVTVRQTDAAGNVSVASAALAFTLDTAAPTTSTITANDLSSPSGATFTFTVPYTDTGSGIDSSTIDVPNVTVTGPAGVGALTVSAASFNAGVATYAVGAPHSGVWNAATDAGTYTIGINGSSVKDLAGNVVAAAASAKTFAVSFNAAPVITSSGSGSVAENAAITTVVYATVATDAESDAITYSLTGTDAASFDISATGDVTLKASADYETKSSYSITVNAKDASHASPTTKSVTVNVTDVNEAPTNLALSATSLPENTATVGTLTSTDPDTGNTFTYSIVGGADQASFEVVGTTLQFKSTAKPNYEAKSSYAVTVRTTDQGGLTFDKPFTITATDANEAPTAVNLTASSLNATTAIANATAGTLAAVDEDTGNTQTFSLVAGNGTNDADNGKFTIMGNTLKVGATPLAAGTYRIMTRATDNGNLTFDQAQTITVTAPPAAPDSGSSTPTVITQQVDGVTVQNTTQTGSDGRVTTTQTVAPISTARSEDTNTQHSNLADIPVVTDSTGKPLIQVSLPLGVGFTVESISTTGTVQTLRERLIAASDPRVDGDAPMQEIINNGIDQYVPAVGDPNQVTVRTVALTVPTGTTTAPASPIVIRGATGAGEDDTAHPQRSEALVIDARKLPSGTVIDLSLVEFAIVVGAVRAVGGTGRNFVIGDDSAQFMVLGADDDVIHGGGGDDTVGAKGGNDRLYGDAGNDRMVGGIGNDTLEGGDGNDILQGGASDAGTWSFTLTPQGQLQVSFAPNSTELADSTGFNAEGKWTYSLGKGPITDVRFAWIYDDYTVAKDVALLVKALAGRLPTLKEMGILADGTYTSQQLGAMAQSYWTLTEGNVGQPLSTQVQAVINKAWGANSASTDLVNLGVNYLNGGGTWSDIWLALARYSTNASKITDTQGGVQLISGSALNETGWSFASGEDTLLGGAGNDVLVGGNGNDVLDGGAGTDVATFLGQLEDYQAALHTNTTTGQHDVWVRNKLTGEVDTMRNVEMMKIGSTLYYLQAGYPQLPDDVYGALSDYLAPSTQDISLIGFHSDTALMA